MLPAEWPPFFLGFCVLTLCGLVMPYGIMLLSLASGNGLSPVWRRTITWTSAVQACYQSDPQEQTPVKLKSTYKHFHSRKFWLQNEDLLFLSLDVPSNLL